MRTWCGFGAALALLCALAAGRSPAQVLSLPGPAGPPNDATVVHSLRGRVTDALTGAPLPRTLVIANSRSALTDAQGRFEFAGFTGPEASVTLKKPGYSPSPDLNEFAPKLLRDLDAVAELKLYPNATITGTVTGRDGLPLTQVSVSLRRPVPDGSNVRSISIGTVQTDSRGEFRFVGTPGRYQLVTMYEPRSRDTGETLLPVTFPDNLGSLTSNYFEVRSGVERRIDLRPKIGPSYPVQVRIEPENKQGGVQIWVQAAHGEAFLVRAMREYGTNGGPIVSLPSGTYTVVARSYDRGSPGDQGTARVTVTAQPGASTVIHLEPMTLIPVELAVDGASAELAAANPVDSNNQPDHPPELRQFNLHLHSLIVAADGVQDFGLRQQDDKNPQKLEFGVPPGRYQLQGSGMAGNWYVLSATYGVANLLSSYIILNSAGAETPIRLVVSNQTGTAQAAIQMPDSVDFAHLYLIPRGPSFGPVTSVIVRPGEKPGLRVPVGSYLAVALDHQIEGDPRDPQTMARFSTEGKIVDVSAGTTTAFSLELTQEKEAKP